MLKCRDVAQEATDYIEKSQPWPRRLGMWLHLMICFHCRRFVHHLRGVGSMGEHKSPDPASPEEVRRVVDHVCKRPHH